MNSGKRLFDLILSFLLLVVFLPLLGLIALVLAVVYRGNPFFLHSRPGFLEESFGMIKFRTMSEAKDSEGNLLPSTQRLTTAGKFLRKHWLDELPQLINVLIGDMSLVGPRPLLHEYLPLYTSRQYRRHEVKPGITGWAQVHGHNNITWEQKLELDVWYVEHRSLSLDIKILFLTLRDLFRKHNYLPTEKFAGNEESSAFSVQ